MCERALIKIGGDATIAAVADMFRQSNSDLRLSACDVLQHVHSDLAVTTALELLPAETDKTIRTFLASGLISHLALEAIDPVRQLVLDGSYDETGADLKQEVVNAATLMGIDFPEREQWMVDVARKQLEREKNWLEEKVRRLQAEKEEQMRQKRSLIRQPVEPYESEEEEPRSGKIGRNDPCPCGSGKKFKKCCLGKHRASNTLF